MDSGNNLNQLESGFFPVKPPVENATWPIEWMKFFWDPEIQNRFQVMTESGHTKQDVDLCVIFSHWIGDNLLHSRKLIYLPVVFPFLRMKSQVISTIWALATPSNLIFLHFCYCIMAYKFIKYEKTATSSRPSNILPGMLFPDFYLAHSSLLRVSI